MTVTIDQLLSSHSPSPGTRKRDRGPSSGQTYHEVDVLYLYGQNMNPCLKILLLRVPHLKDIFQQAGVKNHARAMEELQKATSP